jgi:UDP-N-acetylglucosamine--N-acetylmuramyl-(pentapeptide) pyrophosphoryl-undecaprenol N-acetylglucosamine transferase
MPAVLAAVSLRVPVFLVEPNAVPGRVNRLSARVARLIFAGNDAVAGWLRASLRERIRVTGVPLRRALLNAFPAQQARRKPEPPIRLLIFGGSRGAKQINDVVVDALPALAKLPLEIFHQTGETDRERIAAAYASAGIDARVVAFERDMPARYLWADLAVCRSGALTVAELALAGLPALLVPYPHAADDHQSANAAELARVGAARRLDPARFDVKMLCGELEALLGDPARLVAMARAAQSQARPNAAREIVDGVLAELERRP